MTDEVVESIFSEHWAKLSSHLDEKPREALENHLARQPTAPTPVNSRLTTPRSDEELVLSDTRKGDLVPNLNSVCESEPIPDLSLAGEYAVEGKNPIANTDLSNSSQDLMHREDVKDILGECLRSYVKLKDSRQLEEVVAVILLMLG